MLSRLEGVTPHTPIWLTPTNWGLASYIQINGGQLKAVNGKVFSFLSDFSLKQWEVRYMNSECSRHDQAVMQLRTMIKITPR